MRAYGWDSYNCTCVLIVPQGGGCRRRREGRGGAIVLVKWHQVNWCCGYPRMRMAYKGNNLMVLNNISGGTRRSIVDFFSAWRRPSRQLIFLPCLAIDEVHRFNVGPREVYPHQKRLDLRVIEPTCPGTQPRTTNHTGYRATSGLDSHNAAGG